MREVLSAIDAVDGVKVPMFVLIDELDRCRPTYAIEMLEQVKHLFDVDNTIFLISTDGDQLAHSIKAVYGESFDGKRYLLRFFNRQYRFEQRDLRAYVKYLFSINKIDQTKVSAPFKSDAAEFFVGAMKRYNVTLRDADQCFDILRSIVTVWDYKVPIHLSVMIPLIIFFHRHDMDMMKDFIENRMNSDGRSSEWFVKTTVLDIYQRTSEVKNVSVDVLNSTLLGRSKLSLRDIYDYSRGSPEANYTSEVLSDEMQREHGGIVSGGGPFSIIRDYPEIVRRIGKLVTPGDSN
jgi:hypothetical protein